MKTPNKYLQMSKNINKILLSPEHLTNWSFDVVFIFSLNAANLLDYDVCCQVILIRMIVFHLLKQSIFLGFLNNKYYLLSHRCCICEAVVSSW